MRVMDNKSRIKKGLNSRKHVPQCFLFYTFSQGSFKRKTNIYIRNSQKQPIRN